MDVDRLTALEAELGWCTNLALAESIVSEAKESIIPQLVSFFEAEASVVQTREVFDLSSPRFQPTASATPMLIDLTDDVECSSDQPASSAVSAGSESVSIRSRSDTKDRGLKRRRLNSSSESAIKHEIILDADESYSSSSAASSSFAASSTSSSSASSSSSSSSASSSSSSDTQSLTDASLIANSIIWLLETTFLDEMSIWRESMFAALSLIRCSEPVSQLLIAYMLQMTPEHCAEFVESVHRVLRESLITHDAINEAVVGAVQILSLVNEAAASAATDLHRGPLLRDLHLLENDTVNRCVDLGEDEEFFIRQRTNASSSSSSSRSSPSAIKAFRDRFKPINFAFSAHSDFLFSIESKQKLLRRRLDIRFVPDTVEMLRANYHSMEGVRFNPHLVLNLTRNRLTRDFLNQITRIRDAEGVQALIKPMRVTFLSELGIDAGGLKRECLGLICQDLFKPEYGMFLQDDTTRFVYFNPHCQAHDSRGEMLNEFSLLGNVLALAILNDVLLELPFAPVVYAKLLGHKVGFKELERSFPHFYQSLTSIMNYTGDDIQETFSLTFTVETSQFGVNRVHPLKQNGERIFVNHSNKEEYIRGFADYILNTSIRDIFDAFSAGFWQLLPTDSILRRLKPHELETVLCGVKEMDFKLLEQSTKYAGFPVNHRSGGAASTSSSYPPVATSVRPSLPVIRHFWSVVHSLTDEQKRAFLHFVTGSSSVPVGGLGSLQLHITCGGDDVQLLPSAKTCFATLVLPLYKSRQQLAQKLLIALEHVTGFGNR